MRKIFIILMALILLGGIAGMAQAQTKQVELTFEWEQVVSADFYGWKMWYATAPGGPYAQLGSDIVYSGNPAATYTCDEIVMAPDNAETTFYFVVNAWDDAGNWSANSNEVSYKADFLPPGAPFSLTVTVKSAP